MKRYGILSLALFILLLSTLTASAVPVYDKEVPSVDKPSLNVRKYVSDDEVLVGETVTVHVNISNPSKVFIYNITILEPQFNPSIIKSERNYTTYNWVQLGKDAVITYSYDITPENEGEYTIEPTTITFFDKNGTEYHAKSSYIPFDVNVQEPEEEDDILWRNVLIMTSIFVAIPILTYYGHRFLM